MTSKQECPLFLPQELLENIFQDLDIGSILSLRLTCRTIDAAIASQRVWLHFARELVSRPQIPSPEESLQDYTLIELRQWVLCRYQAEQVLNAPSGQGIRTRTLRCSLTMPTILPGGRWFLSCSRLGEIMVVDMDSPEMVPKVLVGVEQYVEGMENFIPPDWFTVWVDPHEPRLTFKIALLKIQNPWQGSNHNRRACVHIFHACLSGHGKDATLVAEHSRRFEGFFSGGKTIGALNDRYFVLLKHNFQVGDGPTLICDMHIFDLNQNSVSKARLSDLYPPGVPVLLEYIFTELIVVFQKEISFLPGDKLLIIQYRRILIYAFPSSLETSGNESYHPLRTITRDTAVPTFKRSEPYIGNTSTTIMMLRDDELVALVIPHDIHESHRYIPITSEGFSTSSYWPTIAHFDAVEIEREKYSRCILRFYRYPWDPLSDDDGIGINCSRHDIDIPLSAFPINIQHLRFHSLHLAIGRLVEVACNDGELRIYDLFQAKDQTVEELAGEI